MDSNKDKKRFIAYALHGSSTKAAGTAGAAVECAKSGLLPDVVLGVSGGAILAVPFALGMYDEVLHFSRTMRMADWFDKPPVDDNGKITWTAIFRLLRSFWAMIIGSKGVSSLGVQNTQRKLSEIITPDIFDKYKVGNYAPCYIFSVAWRQRKLMVRNAKDLTYQEYLDAVHCSSVLPISGEAGTVDGTTAEFDGGLWTQNPSWWILKHDVYKQNITDLVSIYVSPDNNALPELPEPENIGQSAMGAIDILQQAQYIKEEINEREKCAALGINLYEVRLPLVLHSKYDTDPVRLEYLQRMGKIEAMKEIARHDGWY